MWLSAAGTAVGQEMYISKLNENVFNYVVEWDRFMFHWQTYKKNCV